MARGSPRSRRGADDPRGQPVPAIVQTSLGAASEGARPPDRGGDRVAHRQADHRGTRVQPVDQAHELSAQRAWTASPPSSTAGSSARRSSPHAAQGRGSTPLGFGQRAFSSSILAPDLTYPAAGWRLNCGVSLKRRLPSRCADPSSERSSAACIRHTFPCRVAGPPRQRPAWSNPLGSFPPFAPSRNAPRQGASTATRAAGRPLRPRERGRPTSPGSAGAPLWASSPRAGCASGALLGGQPPKVVRDLSVSRSLHPCGAIRGLDPCRDGSPSARSPSATVVVGSTGCTAPPPTRRLTAPASRGAPRLRRCALPVVVRGWPGDVDRAQELAERATHETPETHRYLARERVAGSSHRVQANA